MTINCWLKCTYNWFRIFNSQKKDSPYWRGLYKCVDSNCPNKFEAIINKPFDLDQINNELIVFIKYFKKFEHSEKVLKKIECRGELRANQAIQLKISSAAIVHSENTIHNQRTKNQNGKYLFFTFHFYLKIKK